MLLALFISTICGHVGVYYFRGLRRQYHQRQRKCTLDRSAAKLSNNIANIWGIQGWSHFIEPNTLKEFPSNDNTQLITYYFSWRVFKLYTDVDIFLRLFLTGA